MERRQADRAFDAFWEAYPRKRGKVAAQLLWARLRPDAALVAEMMTALAWQCQQEEWQDARYIPHPRTWLSQGRWMDERTVAELKPDTRGHLPPCRTNSECIERFAREIDARKHQTSET